ncbi:hypothetical protein VU601_25405 [Klebsiella pneumoniae]|uniref:hypothetical protein n=1 Tax=Klebsiella TaxID=570 RepID=UPI001C011CED|nr:MULTISPECIES: hypothetical protein [Klebsiella]EKZ6650977.1 hypothetical protein [Klebsiella pneumoniae]MBT9335086.1 hypothetical protein [Klebsiella sp. O852]HDT3127560.1 hypothetical protein [Klebsiella variicola]HDU4281745.1 hypothetical protein [Klebsiella variicola]
MKRVTLKEANKSLRIIVKETGYELHSGAGFAENDAFGCRGKVNGFPEFFPDRISIDGAINLSSPGCDIGVRELVIKLSLDTAPSLDQIEAIRKSVEKTMVQTGAQLRRTL